MKIKDVEERTGLSRSNVRFYEKEKLIEPSRNESNGYITIYDSDNPWNGYCCFYTVWYSLLLVYEFVWNNTKNAYFS